MTNPAVRVASHWHFQEEEESMRKAMILVVVGGILASIAGPAHAQGMRIIGVAIAAAGAAMLTVDPEQPVQPTQPGPRSARHAAGRGGRQNRFADTARHSRPARSNRRTRSRMRALLPGGHRRGDSGIVRRRRGDWHRYHHGGHRIVRMATLWRVISTVHSVQGAQCRHEIRRCCACRRGSCPRRYLAGSAGNAESLRHANQGRGTPQQDRRLLNAPHETCSDHISRTAGS